MSTSPKHVDLMLPEGIGWFVNLLKKDLGIRSLCAEAVKSDLQEADTFWRRIYVLLIDFTDDLKAEAADAEHLGAVANLRSGAGYVADILSQLLAPSAMLCSE
jgi:hypothetical protein